MAAGERSADADGHRRSARLSVLEGRRVLRVASTDEVGCGELIGCARRGCLFAAQMLRFVFSPAIFLVRWGALVFCGMGRVSGQEISAEVGLAVDTEPHTALF